MSVRIEHRIGVQTAPDAIWDLLANLEGWRAWNPIHPEATGRIAIGAPLEVVEAFEGLPQRRLQVKIVDWEPLAQLIWSVDRGPMAKSLRYLEIEQLSETGCIFANGEIYDGFLGEHQAKRQRRAIHDGFQRLGEIVKQRAEAAWAEQQGRR